MYDRCMTNSYRLNVNINNNTAEQIRDLKKDLDISSTEIVRNAVALYATMNQAKMRGQTIQIVDSRGKRRVDILIP